MQPRHTAGNTHACAIGLHRWPLRAAGAIALLICMTGAHAATVYQCVAANGGITFRDTPCATGTQQTRLEPAGQPLIGAPGEAAARARHAVTKQRHAKSRSRPPPRRGTAVKPKMSWECHAGDGEVFYRHARCPGSVPGDGTVRSGYAEKLSSRRTRSRHDAWSRVPVHGVKIPRSEACRRIHAAGAAGRDGHLRDDRVSTYDHLMGRDPCDGA